MAVRDATLISSLVRHSDVVEMKEDGDLPHVAVATALLRHLYTGIVGFKDLLKLSVSV